MLPIIYMFTFYLYIIYIYILFIPFLSSKHYFLQYRISYFYIMSRKEHQHISLVSNFIHFQIPLPLPTHLPMQP